jgi:hypothetical protein
MTRINALRKIAETRSSVAWGNLSALVFAAVLIVCSLTVGCSSEKPKPVRSNNQIPVTQAQSPIAAMPAMPAENKPVAKKVVHKKPATVNYTDKTYGVTFEYSRRYAIETGNAAADLLTASPIPMNFVQPGGVALAAVELPETGFVNTDFSSAFFNVSVNKALTADQCNQFAVPQPKVVTAAAAPAEAASTPAASTTTPEAQPASAPSASDSTAAASEQTSAAKASNEPAPASSAEPAPNSKLILGDLELSATETVSGEGARQSDSKYFHVFQNGACYEFALNVTTVASEDGLIKHVDRDKVFDRLEKILATVKINPVTAEVTAETPAAPATPGTPAQ